VTLAIALVVAVSLALLLQSAFTIYLSLYTWATPEHFVASRPPRRMRAARCSFSLLIPARDEAAVIGETMRQVASLRYAGHLFETIVICEAGDHATIEAVRRALGSLRGRRVRLVIYDGSPINKPRALNAALAEATGDVVGVFDAEDAPDPEVLRVVNTIMCNEGVRVVQAGVQLMNLASRWYSALNVLEYFFWFRSRIHFFARQGVIPLGGNTVFFDRALLASFGGWDENCLTEDAEIGIRLSAMGERIRIVYDDRHVTREESPPTVDALVRQRTRWSQGFLQVAARGRWRELPGWHRRALGLYTLLFPLFQAATLLLLPVAVTLALVLRLPTPIAMLSFAPLYLTAFICVIQAVGLLEFAGAHDLPKPWLRLALLPALYLPYNWVLSYAALRAVLRHVRGARNWEKTPHTGVHRMSAPDPLMGAAPAASPSSTRVAATAARQRAPSMSSESFSVHHHKGRDSR
jgi:cellulose synthase/poly-beta-1,6-N-acetylglucosamine synthase-like glycosyltransferase